jgi:pyruvate/2-oxoacid:ferredoxin oxidoreductase alpha subunit
MAKGAVEALRESGVKAGLFRPVTLWPFPADALAERLRAGVRGVVVVEAGPGQLEDELRLALSHAGVETPVIERVRHFGGVLPQLHEIVDRVSRLEEAYDGRSLLQTV